MRQKVAINTKIPTGKSLLIRFYENYSKFLGLTAIIMLVFEFSGCTNGITDEIGTEAYITVNGLYYQIGKKLEAFVIPEGQKTGKSLLHTENIVIIDADSITICVISNNTNAIDLDGTYDVVLVFDYHEDNGYVTNEYKIITASFTSGATTVHYGRY